MNDDDAMSPVRSEAPFPAPAGEPAEAGGAPLPAAAAHRTQAEGSDERILEAIEDAFSDTDTRRGGRAESAAQPPARPPETFGAAHGRAGRPSLLETTEETRRKRLSQMMAEGLQASEAFNVARIMLEDPDPENRWMAAEVLSGAPTAIPLALVISALRDPDERVRASAIRIAAGHGGVAGRLILPSVLDRAHPMAQGAALDVMPSLLAGAPPLPEHDVDMLLSAVGKLDPPPLTSERPRFGALVRSIGITRIVHRLDGPDEPRLGAVRLLSAEGGPQSLRAVIQLARDPVEEIRWAAGAAANALDSAIEPARPWASPQATGTRLEIEEGEVAVSLETGDDELIASLARALADPVEGVRNQARAGLGRLHPEILGAWAASALRDRNRDRVTLGAAVVQQLRLTGLAGAVLERACAEGPDDRGAYIQALMSLRLPPEDLAGLLPSMDPAHRQTAVRVVWQVGGRAILPFLPRLLGDSAGLVRMAVLEVLSDSGDPAGIRVAQRLLAGDSSAAVRATAVHALARAGGPERLAALSQALADPDPDVRATAIELLPLGFSGRMTDLLLGALRDDDERVWRPTLGHLAEVPDGDLGLLWSAIRDSAQPKREELLATLERRHPERLATLAIQNMRASEGASRALAVEIAARSGTPGSTALVVAALDDPDPTVRRTAAGAMSTLRTPLGVAALSRTLQDPQPEVRLEAVRALGVIDDDTVPQILLTALNDPEVRVRETAVDTLAGWRSPAVARRLASGLSTPDLRRAVAEVLTRMGPAAVEPLVDVVTTGEHDAAQAAGQILARISGPAPFVGDLAARDPALRRRGVEVLGTMGGSVAVEALLTVLTDPDVAVRARAATLLGELGDSRAVRGLKRMFTTDPVSEVAAAAERALRRLGELDDEPFRQTPERWTQPAEDTTGAPEPEGEPGLWPWDEDRPSWPSEEQGDGPDGEG